MANQIKNRNTIVKAEQVHFSLNNSHQYANVHVFKNIYIWQLLSAEEAFLVQ